MSFLEVVPPERAGGHGYLNRCLARAASRGLSGAALTEIGMVGALFARYAASLPGADRRALSSMWWQYYISRLLPPALALRMRGTSVVAQAARTRLRVGAHGLVEGFVVDVSSDVARSDMAWIADLMAHLCQPVVAELHRLTRVSRRALWANAASRLEGLRGLFLDLDPAAAGRIGRLLEACDHDGVPNPMFRLLRDGDPTVCCLRDRLPGIAACCNCPVVRRAGLGVARHPPSDLTETARTAWG